MLESFYSEFHIKVYFHLVPSSQLNLQNSLSMTYQFIFTKFCLVESIVQSTSFCNFCSDTQLALYRKILVFFFFLRKFHGFLTMPRLMAEEELAKLKSDFNLLQSSWRDENEIFLRFQLIMASKYK